MKEKLLNQETICVLAFPFWFSAFCFFAFGWCCDACIVHMCLLFLRSSIMRLVVLSPVYILVCVSVSYYHSYVLHAFDYVSPICLLFLKCPIMCLVSPVLIYWSPNKKWFGRPNRCLVSLVLIYRSPSMLLFSCQKEVHAHKLTPYFHTLLCYFTMHRFS